MNNLEFFEIGFHKVQASLKFTMYPRLAFEPLKILPPPYKGWLQQCATNLVNQLFSLLYKFSNILINFLCVYIVWAIVSAQKLEKTLGGLVLSSNHVVLGIELASSGLVSRKCLCSLNHLKGPEYTFVLVIFVFETAPHIVQDGPKLLILLPPPLKS